MRNEVRRQRILHGRIRSIHAAWLVMVACLLFSTVFFIQKERLERKNTELQHQVLTLEEQVHQLERSLAHREQSANREQRSVTDYNTPGAQHLKLLQERAHALEDELQRLKDHDMTEPGLKAHERALEAALKTIYQYIDGLEQWLAKEAEQKRALEAENQAIHQHMDELERRRAREAERLKQGEE